MKLSGEQLLMAVKNLEGEPIKEGEKNLTLARAMIYGLKYSQPEQDSQADSKNTFERYELALRLLRTTPGEVVELDTDEKKMILDRAHRIWIVTQPMVGVEVFGFLKLVLEGKHPDFPSFVAPTLQEEMTARLNEE